MGGRRFIEHVGRTLFTSLWNIDELLGMKFLLQCLLQTGFVSHIYISTLWSPSADLFLFGLVFFTALPPHAILSSTISLSDQHEHY